MHYVLLANDYSAALFYALCAILCLGNFLHGQAFPLLGTQSSSESVSLYMIFFFHLKWQGNMSQGKDFDRLPSC